MKGNDLETREKIIQATLELVRNEKDYTKITVRRIIAAAGVSLSAVNYHFGSKKRLIDESVKRPILEFLASKGNPYETYGNDPVKKLKELVKLPARYLAENPNIARVSILSDMAEPIEGDLTEQTVKYLTPAFREIFPGMGENDAGLELWGFVSLIQTAFLRSAIFTKSTGVDYFNDREREMFLERCVDSMVEKNGGAANV